MLSIVTKFDYNYFRKFPFDILEAIKSPDNITNYDMIDFVLLMDEIDL